jgi:hypothetical protein
MTITITPFTVDPNPDFKPSPFGYKEKELIKRDHLPITYWRIYLDDKYISYTSTKELAEKTKLWMERWLKNQV